MTYSGLRLSESQIQADLDDLESRLSQIDMDSVRRRGARATAEDMREVVSRAIAAHPDIDSPANFISKYYAGTPDTSEGATLSTKQAWQVERQGNDYIVRPRKSARKKALLMEFGRDPIVTAPNNPMRFYVAAGDGYETVFTNYVSGVEPAAFWRLAARKIRADGTLSENLEEELEKEFRDKGFR